jgi:hypothetical protein
VDRRTLRAAIVALLVVLAVGVAAATLNSTLQSGDSLDPGSGGAPTGGSGPGEGSQPNLSGNLSESAGDASAQLCIPGFQTTAFKLGYLAFWVGLGGILFWRLSSRYLATFVFVGVTIQLAALYTVFAGLCGRDIREEVVRNATDLPDETAGQLAEQIGRSGGEAGAFISSNPILTAFIILAAVGLLVGLAVLYTEEGRALLGAGPMTEDEPDFEEEYDAHALRMLGQAAGAAADRIDESGDADNEVYRAWREMTEHIEVDHPEASTPGEFASAAIDAGMDRTDVVELRAVFEEVRYGGLPATAEAERRAVSALRNIENSYADWEAEE